MTTCEGEVINNENEGSYQDPFSTLFCMYPGLVYGFYVLNDSGEPAYEP